MEQKIADEAKEELEWKTGEGLPIRLADIDMVSDDSKANQERIIYCCDICRKDFKSEKQYEQHCKSKIHKKKLAQFEASLALEAVNEADVDNEEALSEDDIGTTTTDNDKTIFSAKEEEENMGLELGKIGLGGSLCFSSKKEDIRKDEISVDIDSTNGNGGLTMTPSLILSTSEKEESAAASFTSSSRESSSSDLDDDFFLIAALEKKKGRGHSFSSSEYDESLEEEGIKQKLQEEEEEEEEPSSMQNVGIKDEGGGVTAAKVALEEGRRRKNRRRNKKQSSCERVSAPAGYGSSISCLVCGEHFPSRSKLFVHLKSSGHAATKI